MNPKLLIVDCDEEMRTQTKCTLAADYDIVVAESHISALESFRLVRPLVVLLNLALPPHPDNPNEGLTTLSELLALERLSKIIIVARETEKSLDLQAIGTGAYNFLIKPIDIEELKLVVRHAFYVASLELKCRQMQQILQGDAFADMIGSSPAIRVVFDSIRKVAPSNAPVLLSGERGTGKEMAARAIHQNSARKHGPFIAINCSAIPESLLHGELFGYEKDSFAGAHTQREGRLDSANGGTVFLEEIDQVSPPIQVKLLRFIQDQSFERFGGRQSIKIDVRVVASTNGGLRKGMTTGSLREDLYYHLAVVQIVLPPLRQREGDVRLLSQYFLNHFVTKANKTGLVFDQEVRRTLDCYPWPGNVRELENCVRRAVIMCDGKHVTVRDLELAPTSEHTATNLKDARENFERDLIQNVFRRHSGKIAPTAAELGISRPTLYDLMQKLGISKE